MLQLRQLIFFFLFYFIHSGHVFLSNKILSQIQSIANNTLAHINKRNSSLLSEKCKNILNEAISREDGSYIIKLYTDSTPTHNNLKGYSTCYDGFYPNLKNRTTYDIKDNLTFLIFSYKNELSKEAISLNSYSNVFGVCVPKGCSIEEYETIFLEFRDLYNVIPNVMNNKFFVTDLKEENEYKNKYFIIFLQFIPCFILLCFVLLVFFPELVYAFTCCCSNTKRNEYEKCFEFKENLNELLPSSNNTKIHNENGLEIVSGLRGIGMILLVCGLVLKNLFITPVKKYTEKEFEIYMGEPFFSMLFFCSKFGYKFLYSISGFSLVYKFLFFLDNEVKTIQGQKEIAESFLLRNSFSSAYGLFRGNLNYKVLFKFIKKQRFFDFGTCNGTENGMDNGEAKALRRNLLFGGLCETVGQIFYMAVMFSDFDAGMPMISAYCVLSVIWSRIFLKEKLSYKHYIAIILTFAGIILLGVFSPV